MDSVQSFQHPVKHAGRFPGQGGFRQIRDHLFRRWILVPDNPKTAAPRIRVPGAGRVGECC
jgi:hypothetical protein